MPETSGWFAGAEGSVQEAVEWLRLAVEVLGALSVGVGAAIAAWLFVRTLSSRPTEGFLRVRLVLARYLILALEFQLAADILSTAIAPSWEQIGKLAAIATIRTVLNHFLQKEMEREVHEVEMERERAAAREG